MAGRGILRTGRIARVGAAWTIVMVALLVWPWLAGCQPASPQGFVSGDVTPVRLGGERFHLELALDPDSRFKGLSGRRTMAEDRGMLFVFPDERVRSFVMRDCWFPIDVIFLDAAGRVVKVHTMSVEPMDRRFEERLLTRYSSEYAVVAAIELHGGEAARLGLTPGTRVELPLERLKAAAR